MVCFLLVRLMVLLDMRKLVFRVWLWYWMLFVMGVVRCLCCLIGWRCILVFWLMIWWCVGWLNFIVCLCCVWSIVCCCDWIMLINVWWCVGLILVWLEICGWDCFMWNRWWWKLVEMWWMLVRWFLWRYLSVDGKWIRMVNVGVFGIILFI